MNKSRNIWKERYRNYKESYGYLFARIFSYPFTWIFYHTSISPNSITIISFIVSIMAAYFILVDKLIIGGILVWFGLVLDFSDGEIARLKNLQSKFGAWFDGITDRISDVIVLGAIVINVYIQNPKFYVLVLCLLAFISTTLWRYFNIIIKTTFFENSNKKKNMHTIGYDVATHAFVVAFATIFNQLFYLVIFFAIVLNFFSLKNIVVVIINHQK